MTGGAPLETAGEPDLRSYTPLKAEDHQRCGMAFTMKVRGQHLYACTRRVTSTRWSSVC